LSHTMKRKETHIACNECHPHCLPALWTSGALARYMQPAWTAAFPSLHQQRRPARTAGATVICWRIFADSH
jgi:hypothetical protein